MRRNRQPRVSHFAFGLIVLCLGAVVVYLGFTKSIPFRHHYEVKAAFASANNIKPGSPVRIAGVNVGKVSDVEPVRRGQPAAMVTMRLDSKALPLHEDARFKVRTRIFVEGNFFVDIQPGSPSAPTVGDGHVFPVTQTADPVQLDQILTTLQSSTRQDLQILLKELDSALSKGGAKGYRQSIPYWTPAYRDGSLVSDATLGEDQHDLSGYIKGAGATAQALDRDPRALQGLITDFNETARALSEHEQALSQTIAELPRTLAAGRPALDALDASFPNLDRFITAFRPAVRSSGPAIDATLPFLHQLRGLVSQPELRGLTADLRPTVPSLAKLNVETMPLYEQVRAASSCQNEVILPWSHDTVPDPTFPAKGEVYTESPKALVGLSGESRSGDANGQWFRILNDGGQYATPNGSGGFLLTGSPLEGANPPKPYERSPLRPDVPCETQQTPDLRTQAAPPPPGGQLITVSGPAATARLNAAESAAVTWLRDRLRAEGLTSVKVSDQPLTPSELPHVTGVPALRP